MLLLWHFGTNWKNLSTKLPSIVILTQLISLLCWCHNLILFSHWACQKESLVWFSQTVALNIVECKWQIKRFKMAKKVLIKCFWTNWNHYSILTRVKGGIYFALSLFKSLFGSSEKFHQSVGETFKYRKYHSLPSMLLKLFGQINLTCKLCFIWK